MRCNECEASGLVEPCFCDCCGRPVSAAAEDAPVSAPSGVNDMSNWTDSPSGAAHEAPMTTDCESCGAPRPPGQKLCNTCTEMFAIALEPPAAVEAPVTFAPPPIPEPPAPAPLPAANFASDRVDFNAEEPFPVARQPWERKDEPAGGSGTVADEAEPLPWWERQSNTAESSADATAPDAHAPQHTAAPPAAPPMAPPVARPPMAPPMALAEGMEAPVRRGPRPVPRPPTPGNITRPVDAPSRRRPMYVLGASLVVLLAAGVPLAKTWLRPTPTVTVNDFEREPPVAPATPAPTFEPHAAARPPQPVPTPRVEATASVSTQKFPEPPPPVKPRHEPVRQAPARGERPAHAVLARNAFNAAAPARETSALAAAVATPAPETVEDAPPSPLVEAAAAVPTGPVFEMGQVDDKPYVANQVDPSVPEEFRDRPLTDLVILRVLVSHAGRAADINILRKSKAGASLDNAVVSAVRRWSFSPARKRGQPVSCWYNVGVPLRLEGRASP